MKTFITLLFVAGFITAFAQGGNEDPRFAKSADLQIESASVHYQDHPETASLDDPGQG